MHGEIKLIIKGGYLTLDGGVKDWNERAKRISLNQIQKVKITYWLEIMAI